MTAVTATLAALGLAGLLLTGAAGWSLLRRRPGRALLRGTLGLPLLALGLAGLVLTGALYGYHRLTLERPVAELRFRQEGPQRYRVTLVEAAGRTVEYPLAGDAWRLEARVLQWRGVATLLGLDPRYRLERLAGRYDDVRQARHGPRTVYDLADAPTWDVWALLGRQPDWLPWVDAAYGSGAYLPMANGARYAVSLGRGGLVARPLNPAAEAAVRRW